MNCSSRKLSIGGFTLLELLASIAVLAILLVLFLQFISLTSRSTRLSNRSADAAAQARLAFDRIGTDLADMVKDFGADFQAANAPAGTTNVLSFLSSVVSAGLSQNENRGLSVICYRVDGQAENKNRACLLRAGKAFSWTGTGFLGQQTNGLPQSIPAAMLPTTSDFDVLAQGVVRMVVGFQLYPDNLSAKLQDGTNVPNAVGQVVYSPPVHSVVSTDGSQTADVIDLSRISSLVIGMVAIDLESLKQLTTVQVSQLAATFTVPGPNELPVATWGATAGNPNLMPATIPLPARQAVRVFQRFYPVTPFTYRDFE